MESIDDKIHDAIINTNRNGCLIFDEEFDAFGTPNSIRNALARLEKKSLIKKISIGVYIRVVHDPITGLVEPTTESIVNEIRRKDNSNITPTGIAALNALGISNQISLNEVYITDKIERVIKLDKRKISFLKARSARASTIGRLSGVVIQALIEIGKENVTEEHIRIMSKFLRQEDRYRLDHDIDQQSLWMRRTLYKALFYEKS